MGDPPDALADQFQLLVARPRLLSDESLHALIDGDRDLTTGWKQRLTSLLPSVDPEQILARMRTDGAGWFQPDYGLDQEIAESSGLEDLLDKRLPEGELLDEIDEENDRSESTPDEDSED